MGEPSWALLFDTGELTHVVGLLEGQIHLQKLQERLTLHHGLRDILIPEIEKYISDHYKPVHGGYLQHVEAARRFLEFTDDLAERIEHEELGDGDSVEFERLWRFFISDAQVEYHHLARKAEESAKKAIAGKQGAKVRWNGKAVVDEIIKKLARKKQYQDLTARDLWDEFLGELDVAQLDPRESADRSRVEYEGGKMAFGTFQNRLNPTKSA